MTTMYAFANVILRRFEIDQWFTTNNADVSKRDPMYNNWGLIEDAAEDKLTQKLCPGSRQPFRRIWGMDITMWGSLCRQLQDQRLACEDEKALKSQQGTLLTPVLVAWSKSRWPLLSRWRWIFNLLSLSLIAWILLRGLAVAYLPALILVWLYGTSVQISGDPRRPQEAQPYVPPLKDEEQPGDFRLIGAMMLGLAAMLTKVRTLKEFIQKQLTNMNIQSLSCDDLWEDCMVEAFANIINVFCLAFGM